MTWYHHLILAAFAGTLGAAVGSFLNVCICRFPHGQSVVHPPSRCPNCLTPIAARDNVPILSWLALRGACRHCGLPISARYPLVEALVSLLFAATSLIVIVLSPLDLFERNSIWVLALLADHLILVSLLVVSLFTAYDVQRVPVRVAAAGMIVGLALGCLAPQVRAAPALAESPWGGLWVGIVGLLVGGGLTELARVLDRALFHRAPFGPGDAGLMAMLGAFLGWQAAALALVLVALAGGARTVVKAVLEARSACSRRLLATFDDLVPSRLDPSLAALVILLIWSCLW